MRSIDDIFLLVLQLSVAAFVFFVAIVIPVLSWQIAGTSVLIFAIPVGLVFAFFSIGIVVMSIGGFKENREEAP